MPLKYLSCAVPENRDQGAGFEIVKERVTINRVTRYSLNIGYLVKAVNKKTDIITKIPIFLFWAI